MVALAPIVMNEFQSNRSFTPSNTQLRYSLPPLVMQGEQTLEVWCLVDLHHLPAPVRVTESADIDHFKEAIKEKFDLSVSTSRLVLWKVRIFYASITILVDVLLTPLF
jgi:hypothetical protein